MTFTIKQFVKHSDTELEAASRALADAFADDDFTSILVGCEPKLIYDFCKAYVVAAKLAGEIYVAESDIDHKIIGCALWFGPGCELFDSEDRNEQAFAPLLSKLRPEMQDWWRTVFMPQYDEIRLNALGPEAMRNAYNLQLIGTVPEARGQGVARALINEVRNKAGGILLSLEAESEENVRVYEKIGFRVTGDCMPVSNEYGSYPTWVMVA